MTSLVHEEVVHVLEVLLEKFQGLSCVVSVSELLGQSLYDFINLVLKPHTELIECLMGCTALEI